jgi:HSP20 family molecular chaperone IbpA
VEEGWSHYSREITYSRFERSLDLPCDLGQAELSAECREGMLLVRVTAKGDK